MAHSLVRIKGSLVNTPHLIEQGSFNAILDYLNQRNDGEMTLDEQKVSMSMSIDMNDRYFADTKTGIMHITGPLTYRTSGWEALCGGTSYEMLKEQMEYFVAKGAKTVGMMVDSGGGEAHGMMDSANYLRKLADENGIKIIAYVDGMSASAAYGISCIADEIVMSSDSQVGSIGVLIQLMNNSKMLEKAGVERTFITAGKDKVPFAKDGSFTEGFIERLQTQVDALYEGFTSHVATHRSLDISAVKGTEANVFMADEAISLGLADKVMTVEEFYTYVADVAQNNIEGTDMNFREAFKLTSNKEIAEMAKLDELQAEFTTLQTEYETTKGLMKASADALLASTEMVASLTEQLESFKQMQAVAEKAAADAKLESRKAALAEVMPVDQVETKLSAYAALDDNTFAFMVGELQTAKEARAESFKAVGSEGVEAEATTLSATDAILKAGVEAAKQLRR